MLSALGAIILLEAAAWLAYLMYSRGLERYTRWERALRLVGVAVVIGTCVWLATSLTTPMDIDASIVTTYAVLHIGWPVERMYTLWRRGSRD